MFEMMINMFGLFRQQTGAKEVTVKHLFDPMKDDTSSDPVDDDLSSDRFVWETLSLECDPSLEGEAYERRKLAYTKKWFGAMDGTESNFVPSENDPSVPKRIRRDEKKKRSVTAERTTVVDEELTKNVKLTENVNILMILKKSLYISLNLPFPYESDLHELINKNPYLRSEVAKQWIHRDFGNEYFENEKELIGRLYCEDGIVLGRGYEDVIEPVRKTRYAKLAERISLYGPFAKAEDLKEYERVLKKYVLDPRYENSMSERERKLICYLESVPYV